MKRLAVLTAVGVLAMCGGASAHLAKGSARVTAESTAYEFAGRKAWTGIPKVGVCRRSSDDRISCDAKVTGDEFVGCEDSAPYSCGSIYHACHFTVDVHTAGYSSQGRVVRGTVECTAEEHWS